MSTTNHMARRMSVNHAVCQAIDFERDLGDTMRLEHTETSWLALLAERFGEVARAVYLHEHPEASLLRLAACCHAWAEAIEEERAR